MNQGVYSQRRFYRMTGYKTAAGMTFPGSANVWYVDSNKTSAVTGSGYNWDDAFLTITEAVSAASANDTILIKGTDNADSDSSAENDYAESVTIPATKPGLKILGMGAGPEGILWTVGTAEGDILTVNAKDCYVSNIRFRPNGATSGTAIKLTCSGDMAENAAGFTVENCIFRSTTETALAGISINAANDVTIRNCVFTSVATAVLSVSPAHSVQYRTRIENCQVDDKCTSGFDIECRSGVIRNNYFSSGLTIVISTASLGGTIGKDNVVTGNHLFCGTSYAVNCEAATDDNWAGNWINKNTEGTEVYGGVTVLTPT